MAEKIYGETDRTRGVLYYVVTNSSDSIGLSVSSSLQTKSYAWSGYRINTTIDGKVVGTALGYANELNYSFATVLSTPTYNTSFPRGKSSYNVIIGSSYAGEDTDYLAGPMSGSTTITLNVPPKPSYLVSYDANGGSEAPSAQTKWYNENLTLSYVVPSRTGYIFRGWATTPEGEEIYQPGSTYSNNDSIILYAVWEQITYSVTYNANGGINAPSNQVKVYGTNLTLSSVVPTREEYNFIGWATSQLASEPSYQPGGIYTSNAPLTLYAIWELAYNVPSIKGIGSSTLPIIFRSDENGNDVDDGEYATLFFSWYTFSEDYPGTEAEILYKAQGAATWETANTVALEGTSGEVDLILPKVFSPDYAYDIKIAVTDSSGGTGYYDTFISVAFFTMDFGAEGKAIGVGCAAPEEEIPENGILEIGMDVRFVNPEQARNAIGALSTGYGYGATTTNWVYVDADLITESGLYRCDVNTPDSNWWYGEHVNYDANHAYQSFIRVYDGLKAERVKYDGVWQPWKTTLDYYFPVGTILARYDKISPASLYGGSWVMLENTFLWGINESGAIGDTGGARTHTLTENEMPRHFHDTGVYASNGSNFNEDYGHLAQYAGVGKGWSAYTGYRGGGAAHNNMPPYTQVAIWRREA